MKHVGTEMLRQIPVYYRKSLQTQYGGFSEGRPLFSPTIGAYFRWAVIWC